MNIARKLYSLTSKEEIQWRTSIKDNSIIVYEAKCEKLKPFHIVLYEYIESESKRLLVDGLPIKSNQTDLLLLSILIGLNNRNKLEQRLADYAKIRIFEDTIIAKDGSTIVSPTGINRRGLLINDKIILQYNNRIWQENLLKEQPDKYELKRKIIG